MGNRVDVSVERLRAALAATLVVSPLAIFPATADSTITFEIPLPPAIVRTIVSTADVEDGASFERLVAEGRVIKRTERAVRMFFAYNRTDAGKKHVNGLIKEQIIPLLTSAGPSTGLKFERNFSLGASNTLLILAEDPAAGLALVGAEILPAWLDETAEAFVPRKRMFETDTSGCFQFLSVKNGDIKKSVSFTSTRLSEEDQEKCLARNLLISLGLQGPVEGPTARNPEHSPRQTGLLDDLALDLLYRPGVRPMMSLDEALGVPSEQ